MKIHFALIAVLFVLLGKAQTNVCVSKYDNIDGKIWVMDSMYRYSTINLEVVLKNKNIVISRNNDGFEKLSIEYKKNEDIDIWENYYQTLFSYYEDNTKKEIHTNEWDNENKVWMDSTIYSRYNENGALEYQVYIGRNKVTKSIVFGTKSRNTYNDNNKVISKIVEKWDKEKNIWIKRLLTLYVYIGEGKVLEKINKDWNVEKNDWVNGEKETRSYNLSGKITQIVDWKWFSGGWVNSKKETKEYFPDDKLKSKLIQFWDSSENNWLNEIYIYNIFDNGKLIKQVVQFWDLVSSTWVDGRVNEKKYNADGFIILNSEMNFNSDTTGSIYLNEYNDQNKLIVKTTKKWDNSTKSWINSRKYLNTYETGKTSIGMVWNKSINEWINNTYYKYILDEKGRSIYSISKKWDSDGGWVNLSKTERKYDNYNHLVEDKTSTWKIIIEEWQINNKYVYFWSEFEINKTDITEVDNLIVYPNPASKFLFIEMNDFYNNLQIDIYNINAEKKISKRINSREKIDISDLSNGVYSIHIVGLDVNLSKVFIVER